MREAYTFDDVLIMPKFSTIESRKDVDLSLNRVGLPYMALPIISANMDTVTGSKMAAAMSKYGGIGCLHRFCTIEENVKMFKESIYGGFEDPRYPIVSVGLGKQELERAEALINAGAYTIVLDIAHGAQLAAVKQINELKNLLGDSCSIIVGNFATPESVKTFLENTKEVTGIKVGLGSGSHCSTRMVTGVGYPQLSAVKEISNLLKNTHISVISDGGMRSVGDIAKSLGAGADLCMLGSMLAGTEETPGDMYYVDRRGQVIKRPDNFLAQKVNLDGSVELVVDEYSESFTKVKKYRGSASNESYEVQNKQASWRTAEGESSFIPYKGSVANILHEINAGLRSSFSYVGAKNLKEFQEKVEFVRVTPSTVVENRPHGKVLL